MKKMSLLILLLFVFGLMSGVSNAATVKKAVKAKESVSKVVAPVVTPIVKEAQPSQAIETSVEEDKLADYKEETNKALSALKSQIEKVSSDNKDAKVGGVVFFRWQKYVTNGGTNVNNFGVDRAYLDFKKKLSGDANVRVTLDVRQLGSDSTKNLYYYLKYAYVELPVGIPSLLQPIPYTLTAKIGLQHTAWVDWADKMFNLRWIAKSLVDNEGVMSSSDFGLGATGKISVANMPDIEYHGTLLNGSGYSNSESDGGKDIGLRLNSTLLQNEMVGDLVVGAWQNIHGATKSDITGTTRQGGLMAGLKNDIYTVYGEYLGGTNISGASIGGKCQVYGPLTAFARVDNYDPDTTKANNKLDRSFYGVIYDYSKDVKFSADMQNVTGGSSASTSKGVTTSVLYLHSMIAF